MSETRSASTARETDSLDNIDVENTYDRVSKKRSLGRMDSRQPLHYDGSFFASDSDNDLASPRASSKQMHWPSTDDRALGVHAFVPLDFGQAIL